MASIQYLVKYLKGFDALEKLNEVIVDQENRPYRDVR